VKAAVIFEATVDRDQAERLADLMRSGRELRPEGVRIATLLYEGGVATLVAVWESRDELERYFAAAEVPRGVELFRMIGVEPELRIVEALESS